MSRRTTAQSSHCATNYVYRLRSESDSTETYVGSTANLPARLAAHNAGRSPHAAKFRPWRLQTYLAFSSVSRARAFESYLKSHSGRAFAAKRLWE